MKIKETIYTEIDERGRIVKRARTVDIYESEQGYGYSGNRAYDCYDSGLTQAFSRRIRESYEDYRRTNEW